MSDIVRGVTKTPPAPSAPATRERGTPEPLPPAPETRPVSAPARRLSLRDLRDATPEKGTPDVAPAEPVPEIAIADDLFRELELFLDGVRGLTRNTEPFPWTELERLIERVMVALGASSDLFWVANNPTPAAGLDYLAFHQARVAVLAVRVGANAGLARRDLIELGMAGALMDVGLWLAPDSVVRRPEVLTGDEHEPVRAHPKASAELLRRWGAPKALVEIVLQHHEREQGQGFPQGLQRDAILPQAKILGLVDTYAGLTGAPSGRTRLKPHEVIRDLVRSKNESFTPALIKALLSEISVFPPGTPIRLNTGEVGRVVAVNRNHPLRPRVELLADSKGHVLGSPRLVDLSETPFLYITGPASEKS